MFKVELNWKEFKVDLISFEEFMREKFESYIGSQAHSIIELYFSKEPRKADLDAINNYYETLTENNENIKLAKPSRLKDIARKDFIDNAKDNILKKRDHELTIVERKLRDGIELNHKEMDTLKG